MMVTNDKFNVVVSVQCFAVCFDMSRRGSLNWQSAIIPLISASQYPCPLPDCGKEIQLRHLLRHVNTHCASQAVICYRCPIEKCKYAEGSEFFFTKLSHCVTHYFRLHGNHSSQNSEASPCAVSLSSKYSCKTCSAQFSTRDAIRLHCTRKSHIAADGLAWTSRQKGTNITPSNSPCDNERQGSLKVKTLPRIVSKKADVSTNTNTSVPAQPVYLILMDGSSVRPSIKMTEIGCQTDTPSYNRATSVSFATAIATSPMPMSSEPDVPEAAFSPLFVEAETFTVPTAMHSTAAQTVDFTVGTIVEGAGDGMPKSPIVDLAAMSVQTDALEFYRWMNPGADDGAYTSHAGTQTMELSDDPFFMSAGASELATAFQNAGTQTITRVISQTGQRDENDINSPDMFRFDDDY